MLVLTRNPDQAVKIGEDIAVAVIEVSGVSVKLGIVAPIMRGISRIDMDEFHEMNTTVKDSKWNR